MNLNYDESGNRVRKLEYFNTQTNPPLITDWDNPGNSWTLYNNEFYVKGADGKDLATYQGSELEDWYVWANDLAGKIRKDKPYYYYKDHLGSVRAVVNENAEIVAAYDYDTWGYLLENRTYNGDSIKYKYTGKELDKESFYDYFGARYYDARIGRWGQVEPLLDKYPSLTPFNYSVNNPLKIIDVNGLDVIVVLSGAGLLKAGNEISPSSYNQNSDIGAEQLLYRLQSFADNSSNSDIDIKGYYSSLGLVGEKNEISEAANFIINNLENSDEKVIIYGYSQGGSNAVELANYLNEKGVTVNVLFTVDAFEGIAQTSGFMIPENTQTNFNYIQFTPDAITNGRGSINKSISSKTKIRNKILKNSNHNSIDEDTNEDVLRKIFNKIE